MLFRTELLLLIAAVLVVSSALHAQAVRLLVPELLRLCVQNNTDTAPSSLFRKAQIPPIRRSLSPNPAPPASKLDRRWWFGWSASLGKEPDDARVGVQYIPPHWIFDHPPANTDAFARWLARLRQQQPDFIQVTLPGGESDKAGTIVVADPETP